MISKIGQELKIRVGGAVNIGGGGGRERQEGIWIKTPCSAGIGVGEDEGGQAGAIMAWRVRLPLCLCASVNVSGADVSVGRSVLDSVLPLPLPFGGVQRMDVWCSSFWGETTIQQGRAGKSTVNYAKIAPGLESRD